MLFVFSEVQVREAIEQIKCLVPLTKHATKIAISHDLNSNLLKFLQNHPHFSFFLAEILPIPCNFGEFCLIFNRNTAMNKETKIDLKKAMLKKHERDGTGTVDLYATALSECHFVR